MKNKFIYDEDLYPSRTREYVTRTLLIIGITIAAMGIGQCMKEPRQAQIVIHQGQTEAKIQEAFERAGSPVPNQMAKACMKTKNPKLMASVAIVESDGTPWAKGKAGERGAWQVIPKVWGSVPKSADGQARHAERILEELVAASPRGSLRCALARYNGGDRPKAVSYRYADKVLKVRKSLG